MNKRLRETIEKIKKELSKEPSLIMIGKINDGFDKKSKNLSNKTYCDFLDVCNGARCGIVDLWSNENIKNNQYRVTDLVGGSDKWVCIGQILYEPLVFNLDDENVYLFYQEHESEMQGRCFGEFDSFLLNYIFGRQYKELVPDVIDDEWYSFLKGLNLF